MWQVGPRSGQGTQGRAGSLSPSDMVEQNRSGIYTQIVYSPAGGKLALMNGQTLSKAFVPLPGGGTAVYNSAGLQYYRHADWLGSSRFASTPTTRAMYSDTAYAPFGETYVAAGTADPSFTGQNQDTVGNLYDFMFREYATQARWPSPDPAGLAAVDPSNPQSWNRYAYVLNNPLAFTDPLGLCSQKSVELAGYCVTGPDGAVIGGGNLGVTCTTAGGFQIPCGFILNPESSTVYLCPNNGCNGPLQPGPNGTLQQWVPNPTPTRTDIKVCFPNCVTTIGTPDLGSWQDVGYALTTTQLNQLFAPAGPISDGTISQDALNILGRAGQMSAPVVKPKFIIGWYAAAASGPALVFGGPVAWTGLVVIHADLLLPYTQFFLAATGNGPINSEPGMLGRLLRIFSQGPP